LKIKYFFSFFNFFLERGRITGNMKCNGHEVDGVLFDLDGTLIDTERLGTEGWKEACLFYHVPFDIELVNSMKGRSGKDDTLLFDARYKGFPSYQEARNIREKYVSDYFRERGVPLLPGALALLSYLKGKNIPMGVATSSNRKYLSYVLSSTGMGQYFQGTVTGEEVQKGKPDPSIFVACSKLLATSPGNTLVVEDSRFGLLAAYKGGFLPIGIPNAYPFDEAALSLCVSSFSSLEGLLGSIRKENP
jgi:HAD superfamily hydrolase (TIGR01509 family)